MTTTAFTLPNALLLLLLLSCLSRIRLCATPKTAAHQAPCPWDSPGKNTGMGCLFLLQCVKVKSESEVAPSCPTPSNPMDCGLPGPSVHGIFQARVLEWVAIAFSGPMHYFFSNYMTHLAHLISNYQSFKTVSTVTEQVICFHHIYSFKDTEIKSPEQITSTLQCRVNNIESPIHYDTIVSFNIFS